VGLYDAITGDRLQLDDGTEYVTIGVVNVYAKDPS